MATYDPPVSRLLTLGKPANLSWDNYAKYGIGAEHVPELIRLLQDDELAQDDSESPFVYAQVHAWRALAGLRAEDAIEPLLGLLATQDHGDEWDDWITEEVPRALAMIGPAALAPTAAALRSRPKEGWAPIYFATALAELAKCHPERRAEVVASLERALETAAENDPGVNASIIGDLLDLNAVESWPAIERTFATGNVDESFAGDVADVKWELGLGPKPPPRRYTLLPEFDQPPGELVEVPPDRWRETSPPKRPDVVTRLSGGRSAKERADARKQRRKDEKRKKRKGD